MAKVTAPTVEELDSCLEPLEPLRSLPGPAHWVRTIREGLGMTVEQLARRAGLSPDALVALEEGSSAELCRLADYERIAAALGCSLVCGLVPKQSLKALMEGQARRLAERRIQSVAEVMSSQGHQLTPRELKHHVDEFARVLLAQPPHTLWDAAVDGVDSCDTGA